MTDQSTPQQISDELDKQLLQAIRAEGVTAAMLNVARQRCKDLGMTKVVTNGDPVAEMADELGLRDPSVLKMPGVSDKPDKATGT